MPGQEAQTRAPTGSFPKGKRPSLEGPRGRYDFLSQEGWEESGGSRDWKGKQRDIKLASRPRISVQEKKKHKKEYRQTSDTNLHQGVRGQGVSPSQKHLH